MGWGDRLGGYQSRRRLATLLFVSVFLFASLINSLGTTQAQAISLPIGAILDAIIPGDQSGKQTPPLSQNSATPPPASSEAPIDEADVTAPSVPTNPFTPADLSYGRGPAQYSWGSSSDDRSGQITYEIQASQTKSTDESGQTSLVNPQSSGALSDTTYSPATQAEGIWYWQVRARDAAGNDSKWSTIHEHTIDNTVPVVAYTLITDQEVSGEYTITAMITELNPQEYAIKVVHPDGADVKVDDQLVGITQNPAQGDRLDFMWDTTLVANGSYRVVFGVRDQAGNNSDPLEVPVVVKNDPTTTPPVVAPPFTPLTPDLTPVALNPSVVMTVAEAALSDTAPSPQETTQSSDKKDVLAKRIETAASQKQNIEPSVTCARFFGVCWYWSAPGTLLVAVGAFVMHRLRHR